MAEMNENLKSQLLRREKLLTDELDEKGWRSTWQEIQENLLPDRGRFLSGYNETEVNDGSTKRDIMLSSIPERAVNNLASGLKSYLTTPSRPWFKLKVKGIDEISERIVELWLDDVTAEMHAVFRNSNFYDALHNTYIEFAGFGTGCMFILEDAETVINCIALTIGEYAIDVDHRGRVDTIIRTIGAMTANQMVKKFGIANVSEEVRDEWKDQKSNKKWEVLHLVTPNDGRLDVDDPLDRPFSSVYFIREGSHLLKSSGYEEFPAVVPRWNVVSNNVYGTECPGMMELGNIKELYFTRNKRNVALEKIVEPPVWSNNSSAMINLLPGGVSQGVDPSGNQQWLGPVYQIKPDMQAIQTSQLELGADIQSGFFNHLFMLFSGDSGSDRKTTFEAARLQEEKMSFLGPMIERLNNSTLRLIIDRTFGIMERDGYFDEDGIIPAPEDLRGAPIDIEYISILAQAQKSTGLRSVDSIMLFIQQAAALDPSVLDRFDMDQATQLYIEGTGGPAVLMRSDDEVEAIRQQRAQQEQAQQALQSGIDLVGGMKTSAETQAIREAQ